MISPKSPDSQSRRLIRKLTASRPSHQDAHREVNRLFDASFYRRQLGLSGNSLDDAEALEHYFDQGMMQRLSPHPLFDASYYQLLYADLEDVVDLFGHYLQQGQTEERIPHPLFDPLFYSSRHGIACGYALISRPFTHFLTCPHFSAPTVLWRPARNLRPEAFESAVEDCMTSPGLFLDYLRGDLPRSFVPHALFDPSWFLQYSHGVPDGVMPLVHYASRTDDSRATTRCHPMVDESWYVHTYGAEMTWWEPVLSHYLKNPETAPSSGVSQLAFRRATGRYFEEPSAANAGFRCQNDGASSPSLSVLIINIDALPTTVACVEALRDQSGVLPFQVIVMDNGSSDPEEAKRLSSLLPDVEIVTSRHRYSFGEANNLMAALANGPDILFLNNDAVISADHVRKLQLRLNEDLSIAAVGPLFVYPDGTIQEAGGRIVDDGTPIQLGKGSRVLAPQLAGIRDVDYVSGACVLMRKDTFDQASGFSVVYEPAYFEDTDLLRRLRALGRVVVDTGIEVPHFEGFSTAKASVVSSRDAVIQAARTKWLTRFAEPAASPPPASRRRPASKKPGSAWLFSPYGLQIGGGERYFLSMAHALSGDWKVSLVFQHAYSAHRLAHVQFELGLPTLKLDIQDTSIFRTHQTPDLFIAMGNHLCPPVVGIGSRNIYHLQFPFPSDHDFALSTRKTLATYDVIVVNSEFSRTHVEQGLLRLGISIPVVVVIPPCGEFESRETDSHRTGIATLGRFFADGHNKQHAALLEAFDQVLVDDPTLTLTIAGSLGSRSEDIQYLRTLMSCTGDRPVRWTVNPSRMQVRKLLSETQFYWHATGLGIADSEPHKKEHFGISIVEAYLHGALPIAIGAGGPLEILRETPELLVDSANDMAWRTTQLLARPEAVDSLMDRLTGLERYSDTTFQYEFSEFAKAMYEHVG